MVLRQEVCQGTLIEKFQDELRACEIDVGGDRDVRFKFQTVETGDWPDRHPAG